VIVEYAKHGTKREGKMIRKMALIALLAIFGITSQAQADISYETDLTQAQKELAELDAKIKEHKEELALLTKQYNDADIKLRQELIACKAGMDKKAFVRESKSRQAEMRANHKQKFSPVKAEYNRLKTRRALCNRKIKSLEKKIDRASSNPGLSVYEEKINALKSEITSAKNVMNKKIADLYAQADTDISGITDMSNKSRLKNQILKEAKANELSIRKQYKEEKQAIVNRMDAERKLYKDYLAEYRLEHANEPAHETVQTDRKQAKQKKGAHKAKKPAHTNFSSR